MRPKPKLANGMTNSPKQKDLTIRDTQKHQRTKPEAKIAVATAVPPTVPIVRDEHNVVHVDPAGDLVLEFEHHPQDPKHNFRVSAERLRQSSPYFRLLLDPDRFQEGRHVASAHLTLDATDPAAIPSDQLPRVAISDLGQISPVKSIESLVNDLLRLIHHLPLATASPPLSNLANLTVVADRFDCLAVLTAYAHQHRLFQLIDSKMPPSRIRSAVPELKLRQKAYIGLLLGHSPWLTFSSQRLIQRSTFAAANPDLPQWFDLPQLEDELSFRRSALLATIHSAQSYYLTLYASPRQRQCKLGYDSSSACDSFQLGEMVRFLTRIGTLSLSAASPLLLDPDSDLDSAYAGDLLDLLDRYRQCTEYQIDAHHHHCGLRTRLLPVLDALEKAIEDAGVCGECWAQRRDAVAWRGAKGPLCWRWGDGNAGPGCAGRHAAVRDLCLATERVWERPKDGAPSGLAFGESMSLRRIL